MSRSDQARRADTGTRIALLIVLLVVSFADAGAVVVSLSTADTQRAMKLAGESDAARGRFHAPYTILIKDSVIREIQAITEFRRVVLATEDALKRGDWAVAHGARSLAGRGIDDIVKPWRRKVTIVANLQLNAMHTYISVPHCEVMLAGTPILPSLDRRITPLSSLPYSSRGKTVTSLVGANIEEDFDAEGVGQTSRLAIVMCDGKDVARATIDFSRLE